MIIANESQKEVKEKEDEIMNDTINFVETNENDKKKENKINRRILEAPSIDVKKLNLFNLEEIKKSIGIIDNGFIIINNKETKSDNEGQNANLDKDKIQLKNEIDFKKSENIKIEKEKVKNNIIIIY